MLRALNAPKFVYRYSKTKDTIRELQNKLECRVLTDKYSQYLSNYNTFALFQWECSRDTKFDTSYFWKEFADSVASSTRNSIFLQDKVHMEAMYKSLKIPVKLPENNAEYRCTFQTVSEPESINHMLRLTREADAKLRLHTLGLNTWNNSIASYIQSLLEESESMYKDLSYEKLLSIAKKSRSEEGKPIKELLNHLVDKGITNPRIARAGQWLILSKT